MADEYLENTTPASGDIDESFEVYLPVARRWMDRARRTWRTSAATKRSTPTCSPSSCARVLDASAPLRAAVADSTVEEIKFALNGLGPARVESIDPI